MNRRRFLQWMGLGSLAVSRAGRSLGGPAPVTPARQTHWAWTRLAADAGDDEIRDRLEAFVAADVQRLILPAPDARIGRLAAEAGLQLHAWWWTLCRGDEALLRDHPGWYAVSREDRSTHDHPPYVPYYHFLCPTRAEVRRYLGERLAETLANPHLAGVSLDYVRFPDVILPRALWKKYGLVQNEELPPYDFCYCQVCRDAFRAQTGVDPLDLPDPAAHTAWRRFRWDAVTRLVNELAAVARARGKMITASVFPSPEIARRLVRQDWPAWRLDAVLPMVYHNFYDEGVDWIEPTVAEGVAALPLDRPLYAALYLPALQEDGAFERAVARARAGGARGIALFGGVRKIPAP